MDLSEGAWIQLIAGLGVGVVLFAIGLIFPARLLIQGLILLIPFQIIDSQYGSMNTVATYVIGAALLCRGKITAWPLLSPVAAIVLTMFAATVLAPRVFVFDNLLFILAFGSNLIVMYVVYNHVRTSEEANRILNTFVALNILVSLYCYIQLLYGFEKVTPFGIGEFTFTQNRSDFRLAGPFTAVGITAEYLALQVLILLYLLIRERSRWKWWLYVVLIVADFAFLVATGNRGGVVSLVLGLVLFGIVFRRDIGMLRMLVGGSILIVGFCVSAVLVVTQTEFSLLFERFANTTVEGGIPDTRQEVWAEAWKFFKERPIMGHGPRLEFAPDVVASARIPWMNGYPHNLVLYILCTLGIVGLIVYVVFGIALVSRLKRRLRAPGSEIVDKGVVRLGFIILVTFVVDQIKVEFLRSTLIDYQNYVFALFGLFLAAAGRPDRPRSRVPSNGTVQLKQSAKRYESTVGS